MSQSGFLHWGQYFVSIFIVGEEHLFSYFRTIWYRKKIVSNVPVLISMKAISPFLVKYAFSFHSNLWNYQTPE